MEEDDGTGGASIRLQNVGPVPVLREMARIDRTAFEIPVDRDAILLWKPLRDLGPHGIEDGFFGLQVPRPICFIEFMCMQFVRHIGMPGLQRRSNLRLVSPSRK